jgi:phosphate uptake regulator
MPREAFEHELRRLQDDMLVMAKTVKTALSDAVEALKRRDMEVSRELIARDRLNPSA